MTYEKRIAIAMRQRLEQSKQDNPDIKSEVFSSSEEFLNAYEKRIAEKKHGGSYQTSLNDFGANEIPEPKVNWFDIYVKKEKEFIKSIRDIDAKMNFIIRTLGEVEQRLLSKMEYLEHRIDSLNE